MTYVVAVAKIGERADSTDPNDFIFHSSYNTFKIVLEGTKSITLAAATANQSFTQAHGLRFIPLVDAFAKLSTDAVVCRPNGVLIEGWSDTGGWTGDVTFNYISTDATNITFNLSNAAASTKDVSIRYFCLEKVD